MNWETVQIDGKTQYSDYPSDTKGSYRLLNNHSTIYKKWIVSWATAGWAKRHTIGIL